jgi:hypothetical protein
MTEINRSLEALLPNQHAHQSRVIEHAAVVSEVAQALREHGIDGTASLFEQIDAICSLALAGVVKPQTEVKTPTDSTTPSA